jgi:hypothetical protein
MRLWQQQIGMRDDFADNEFFRHIDEEYRPLAEKTFFRKSEWSRSKTAVKIWQRLERATFRRHDFDALLLLAYGALREFESIQVSIESAPIALAASGDWHAKRG